MASASTSETGAPPCEPAPPGAAGLSKLVFEATFVKELPADPETRNFKRQVHEACYSLVAPTDPRTTDQRLMWRRADPEGEAAAEPQLPAGLIAWSTDTAALFDLDDEAWPSGKEEENAVEVLGGFGPLWPGMVPYAQCYSGHQFGSWAGQLGDGRAISMGEYVNNKNERWEIQLKGAGMTPYSRSADGRAVLRSSVREYLASEAMFHLGVPTTRALSLVSTGTGVIRDMFYMGDPKMENGAVVARVAPSFLRIGTFQHPSAAGDHATLKTLADYAIKYHFPSLESLPDDTKSTGRNRYSALVAEVLRRNVDMVAKWQGLGFVHGVLNTDNTSLLGLTIDYGPYGFLDNFSKRYTPNTTDMPGRRYCYENQPNAIRWNLRMFAEAMVPLCGLAEMETIIRSYWDVYNEAYNRVFAAKLGVAKLTDDDKTLVDDLLSLMETSKADFTNTWRALSSVSAGASGPELERVFSPLIANKENADKSQWASWFQRYSARLSAESAVPEAERIARMNRANPVYILRNYMAQEAIDAANAGNFTLVRDLEQLLKRPYEVQEGAEHYTQEPPAWASRPGVCVNSCSS